MLVLSRKRDETIVINDNIQITIVAIKGDKVRVGIEAPIEVSDAANVIEEISQVEEISQAVALFIPEASEPVVLEAMPIALDSPVQP